MFSRSAALILAGFAALRAQAPLENDGKPMRVAFECASADAQGAGLGCAEGAPCPVYLELANVDALGDRIFIAGNLHTPMVTLASILLTSEDGGKSWFEPHPRIPNSGLDQIRFADFEHGWISGANLLTAPRDPFLLATTDGGKMWRALPVFNETRVAAIESFHFDTPMHGQMFIDASLENGNHEVYETHDGGVTWLIERTSGEAAAPTGETDNAGWRVHADAVTHSYNIEKPQNGRWQRIASFLIQIAACKP